MSSSLLNVRLSFALLLVAATSRAQTFQTKSVTFSGYPASKAELLAASGLPHGSAITQAEMQAAAQKLSETGLFENVQFSFDGRDLTYQLKPATNTVPVQFANFPWWESNSLETALEGKIILFHGRVTPDSGLQTQVIGALTSMLAEKQVTASVSAIQRFVKTATNELPTVEFRIDKPPVEVGAISFLGASAGWPDQLSGVVTAESGRDYSEASTPAELKDAVGHVYRKKGFLEESAEVERQTPALKNGKVLVPFAVSISEGQQYRLGRFTFTGPVLMSQEEFDKLAQLKSGDVVDEDKLHATMKEAGRPYGAKGYLHAKIEATPQFDRDKHTVAYAITVSPGDLYTMGTLELRGLDDSKKDLVTKTWKLKPGDPFDGIYASSFLVSNKNILSSLDGYSANYKQIEHLDTHTVDMVVSFFRMPPGQRPQ